jgi:hypothetical protein
MGSLATVPPGDANLIAPTFPAKIPPIVKKPSNRTPSSMTGVNRNGRADLIADVRDSGLHTDDELEGFGSYHDARRLEWRTRLLSAPAERSPCALTTGVR